MSKAYLIMDMPKNCAECSLCSSQDDEYFCISDDFEHYLGTRFASHNATERPNWCPLRELPQRVEEAIGTGNMFKAIGWNECIDEIMRGSE